MRIVWIVLTVVGCKEFQLSEPECGLLTDAVEPDEVTALGFSANDVVAWFGSRIVTASWDELWVYDDSQSTMSSVPALPPLEIEVSLPSGAADDAPQLLVMTETDDGEDCSPYATWLDAHGVPADVSVFGQTVTDDVSFEAVSLT